MDLCPGHSVVMASDMHSIAESDHDRAVCDECPASGRVFDTYVVHPLGMC